MAEQDKKNNPRNPESKLFRKLTRLLSGPVVNYRRQMPRRFQRRQLDNHKFIKKEQLKKSKKYLSKVNELLHEVD